MKGHLMHPLSKDEILRRAAHVEAWARRHWNLDDLEHSTRTPALRPGGADDPAAISVTSVESVARLRAEALRSEAITPEETTPDGRMLAFDPSQSLSDGAAAAESAGFFDDDNAPPWDCWLVFVEEAPRSLDRWSAFDSYLLCWIPGLLVEVVRRAVEANPEECLRWADQLRTPFLDQLRRSGMPLAPTTE
jgi:hypothetical protein